MDIGGTGMTALVEPGWQTAKVKADKVRAAHAELRREMKPMSLHDGLRAAATVLENPTPEQGALPLYRLMKMVPRFRETHMRKMTARAQILTWDRRLRDLTQRQRTALAVQFEDHAEGYWRG